MGDTALSDCGVCTEETLHVTCDQVRVVHPDPPESPQRGAEKLNRAVTAHAALVIWIVVSYLALPLRFVWAIDASRAAAYLAVLSATLAMAVWSYYQAMFTDPGRPHSMWRDHAQIVKYDDPSDSNVARVQVVYAGEDEDPPGLKYQHKDRWCNHCRSWQPPRAQHCSRCNRCVLRYDSHVFIINNCIGHHNHKFWLLYVAYQAIACGFAVATTGPFAWACTGGATLSESTNTTGSATLRESTNTTGSATLSVNCVLPAMSPLVGAAACILYEHLCNCSGQACLAVLPLVAAAVVVGAACGSAVLGIVVLSAVTATEAIGLASLAWVFLMDAAVRPPRLEILTVGVSLLSPVLLTAAGALLKPPPLPGGCPFAGFALVYFAVFLLVIAIVLSVILAAAIMFQYSPLLRNKTQVDRWQIDYGPDGNVFDIGCWGNVEAVFGRRWLQWPLPVAAHPRTCTGGAAFPVAQRAIDSQRARIADPGYGAIGIGA